MTGKYQAHYNYKAHFADFHCRERKLQFKLRLFNQKDHTPHYAVYDPVWVLNSENIISFICKMEIVISTPLDCCKD